MPFHAKTLIGWGTSRHGQLVASSSHQPKPPAFFRLPQELHFENTPTSSSLGIHHSVFLHPSGRISTLGSNRKGQLQAGLDVECGQQIVCTWNGAFVVRRDNDSGSVSSSDSISHSQLDRGSVAGDTSVGNIRFAGVDTKATGIRLAAGSEHVSALIVSDEAVDKEPQSQVWAWAGTNMIILDLGIPPTFQLQCVYGHPRITVVTWEMRRAFGVAVERIG